MGASEVSGIGLMRAADTSPSLVLIIYDGVCPFCSAYAKFLRLQQSVGPVELLSARADDPRIEQYVSAGYELDEGMLVVADGQVQAGADAVHWLALHSPADTLIEKLYSAVFRRKALAHGLYPLAKLGRRAWLALRGRPLIRDARQQGSG